MLLSRVGRRALRETETAGRPPGFPIVPESDGVCQSAAAALFLSNLVCYSGQTKEYYMSQEETLDQLLERIRSRFRVDFKPLDIDGRELQVLDVENMTQYLDKLIGTNAIKNPLLDLPLWAKVWPGSFILEIFLRKKCETKGKTFLELGCGCGILSILASRLGFSHMTASDIEEDALLFTKANVLKNNLQDLISVQHVDVARPGADPRFSDGVDIVAASEILYLDSLHRPLLNFLSRHLKKGGRAVFCTDMARRKPHFAKLASKEFKVSECYLPGTITGADGKPERRLYALLTVEK